MILLWISLLSFNSVGVLDHIACAGHVRALSGDTDPEVRRLFLETYSQLAAGLESEELQQLLKEPFLIPKTKNLLALSGTFSVLRPLLKLILEKTSSSFIREQLRLSLFEIIRREIEKKETSTQTYLDQVPLTYFNKNFVLKKSDDAVNSLFLSPSGDTLYVTSGTDNESLDIWNTKNGQHITRLHFPHHSSHYVKYLLSPNGERLYFTTMGGGIKSIHLEQGRFRKIAKKDSLIFSGSIFSLNHTGRILFSIQFDGTIALSNASNAKRLIKKDGSKIYFKGKKPLKALIASSDGKYLFATDGEFLYRWSLDYKRLREGDLPPETLAINGFLKNRNKLQMSPNNKFLIISNDGFNSIDQLVNTETLQPFKEMHNSSILGIPNSAIHRNGNWIFYSKEMRLNTFDVRTGAYLEVRNYDMHRSIITALALSSDGKTIYTSTMDGTIRSEFLPDSHDLEFSEFSD